jgi:hypothetical protein
VKNIHKYLNLPLVIILYDKTNLIKVQLLVLITLKYNIWLKAQHISGSLNKFADSLSRCNWQLFRELAQEADKHQTTIPSHLWRNINIEADRLITHSMAANTWKTYKTAVDSINEFRHIYALSNSWSIPLDEIIDYIAYLSYTGLSSSTISTYISGISYAIKYEV